MKSNFTLIIIICIIIISCKEKKTVINSSDFKELKSYLKNDSLVTKRIEKLKNTLEIEKSTFTDQVKGRLNMTCMCGGRPMFIHYTGFRDITVIREGNDWTIFGLAITRDATGTINLPFTLDLLESSNKFEIRIQGQSPYIASLNDLDAISYRISNSKIIIRCVKIVNSRASCCYLAGTLAAETTE